MQMGFNNDVDYKGLVVHIQTEDHGLKSKKITSQVFHGGAILESKTVSYAEDIKSYDDDASRGERIKKLMKALHRKMHQRIHEGLHDELLPIGEVRVSAAHLTVKHDDEAPSLSTPGDLEEEGIVVAGEHADVADEYEKKSRGKPLDDFEPGQLGGVAEQTAAAVASMSVSGFVPVGGLGAGTDVSPSQSGLSAPIVYSDSPAFRGLEVAEESLGAVLLEAVHAQ
jgi:hypothetical protein